MISYKEALKLDGAKYKATILSKEVEGVVAVEDKSVYLLQNSVAGGSPSDKRGYAYSWCIYGSDGGFSCSVQTFEIIKISDTKYLTVKDLLDKDGYSVIAEGFHSSGSIEGKISVEGGQVFLCQNFRDGNRCKFTKGYKYSYDLSVCSSSEVLGFKIRFNSSAVAESVSVIKPLYLKDLLTKDGWGFTATKLCSKFVEGKITVEGRSVYLCQNERDGSSCRDKKGYKYSYTICNEDVSGIYGLSLTTAPPKAPMPEVLPTSKFNVDDKVISKPGLTDYRYGGSIQISIGTVYKITSSDRIVVDWGNSKYDMHPSELVPYNPCSSMTASASNYYGGCDPVSGEIRGSAIYNGFVPIDGSWAVSPMGEPLPTGKWSGSLDELLDTPKTPDLDLSFRSVKKIII